MKCTVEVTKRTVGDERLREDGVNMLGRDSTCRKSITMERASGLELAVRHGPSMLDSTGAVAGVLLFARRMSSVLSDDNCCPGSPKTIQLLRRNSQLLSPVSERHGGAAGGWTLSRVGVSLTVSEKKPRSVNCAMSHPEQSGVNTRISSNCKIKTVSSKRQVTSAQVC